MASEHQQLVVGRFKSVALVSIRNHTGLQAYINLQDWRSYVWLDVTCRGTKMSGSAV